MKRSQSLHAILFITICLFISCQKENVEKSEAIKTQSEAFYYTPSLSDFDIDIPEETNGAQTRSGYFTVVPAGSVNALSDAIAGADEGGIIYLKSGMHVENQRVMVTKRVNIIGEDGATLMIDSDPDGPIVNPGIHVLNADGTMIKNIILRANQGNGWCAILLENSFRTSVLNCDMSKFNRSIIIEESDQAAIINNVFTECVDNGILANNGESVYVGQNRFENNAGIAIWACDKWGTLENNQFIANGNGALLCNWPSEFGVSLPDGTPLDALSTCIGWKVRSNNWADNTFTGLNIRDAAHWNLVESNNTYSNNGLYDIDIPDDEDLVIIFVPKAYSNTINATPNVRIRNCGENNTIIGGTLVDPCN